MTIQLRNITEQMQEYSYTENQWCRELRDLGFGTIIYDDIHVTPEKFQISTFAPAALKPQIGTYVIIGSPEYFRVVQVKLILVRQNFILDKAIPEYFYNETHNVPRYFTYPDGFSIFKDTWNRIQRDGNALDAPSW